MAGPRNDLIVSLSNPEVVGMGVRDTWFDKLTMRVVEVATRAFTLANISVIGASSRRGEGVRTARWYMRDYRTGKDVKIYNSSGRRHLNFHEEIVNGSHIFRTPYSVAIFCDDVLKTACKMADVKGVWFIDAVRV